MINETAVRIHSAKHAKLLFCSFFLEERKNKEKFVALYVHPAKLFFSFLYLSVMGGTANIHIFSITKERFKLDGGGGGGGVSG